MTVLKRNCSATIREVPVPSLTIRNLPPEVHRALAERARSHRRSLNQELLEILTREAAAPRVDPEAFILGTRALHRRLGIRPLPDLDGLLRDRREGLS